MKWHKQSGEWQPLLKFSTASEACMRYVGVTRDQGWETTWTVEGSLGEMVGALTYLALDPEWGGGHIPVWAELVGVPLLGSLKQSQSIRPVPSPSTSQATNHSSSRMPLAPKPAASSTGSLKTSKLLQQTLPSESGHDICHAYQ